MNFMDELKNRGWYLTEEGIEMCKDDNSEVTVASIIKKALDMDLREIGSGCLPDDNTKVKTDSISGPCVLQIQKLKNVSAPKYGSSSGAPSLLRLLLTDGRLYVNSLQWDNWKSINLDTPPGTKILLKPSKMILQNGFILLKENQVTILGGHVTALIDKWELSKSLASYVRAREGSDGGPPPWIPFGKAIDYKDVKSAKGNFQALDSEGKEEKEDAAFKQQRLANIAEVSKAKEGKTKIFGGGKDKPAANRYENNYQQYNRNDKKEYKGGKMMKTAVSQEDTRPVFTNDRFNSKNFPYKGENRNKTYPTKADTNNLKVKETENNISSISKSTANVYNKYNPSSKPPPSNREKVTSSNAFRTNSSVLTEAPKNESNTYSDKSHYKNYTNNFQVREKNVQVRTYQENKIDYKNISASQANKIDYKNNSASQANKIEYKNNSASQANKIEYKNNSASQANKIEYKNNSASQANKIEYKNNSASQANKIEYKNSNTAEKTYLKPGAKVLAKYWEDNKFYPALIYAVGENGATYVVHFVEYGNYEEVLANDVFQTSSDWNLTTSTSHPDKQSNYGNSHFASANQEHLTGTWEFRKGGSKPYSLQGQNSINSVPHQGGSGDDFGPNFKGYVDSSYINQAANFRTYPGDYRLPHMENYDSSMRFQPTDYNIYQTQHLSNNIQYQIQNTGYSQRGQYSMYNDRYRN